MAKRATKLRSGVEERIVVSDEFITIIEAAKWVKVSPRTFEGWIRQNKITRADGLRKVGPFWRIVAGVMRQRMNEGTFGKFDAED